MTAYMEKRGSAAGWAVEALERMLGGQLLALLDGSVLQLCGRHVSRPRRNDSGRQKGDVRLQEGL